MQRVKQYIVNFLLTFLLFVCFKVSGQNKSIFVKLIDNKIEIDGVLDEEIWGKVEPAKDFWQYFPSDTILSLEQSEIKMLYDKKYLYLGVKVYARGKDYIIPSLRRDFRARGNDNISFLFDTFNDGANAFFFGTNPYGVPRESLISGGGADFRNFNSSWDVKWIVESKIFDNYYTAEMRIPLSAFKFTGGEKKWRFNSYRFDTQTNERSTWIRIPQNQIITNLAFMGDMIFEEPLTKIKTPFAIIPYISGELSKNFDANTSVSKIKVGGDAKIPIGNGLNLDLTINPDFSQVEVDEQLVNLTRFELFLPEKRQFFIDNADLFADFGNGREANPFFSRRIGIAKDKDGNTIENPIVAGLRLSGKVNEKFRLGVLNIQTKEDAKNEIPGNNNSVLAMQYKVLKRSNIGFIFVNRQATTQGNFIEKSEEYNRVAGLDFNLASEDNTWNGRLYYHQSFTPETENSSASSGGFLEYNKRAYKVRMSGMFVGDDFQSDLGFVRRKDVFRIDPNVEFFFYPEKSKINRYSFRLQAASIWKPELNFMNSDYSFNLSYDVRFENQNSFTVGLNHRYIYLFNDFDPTGSGNGEPLPGETGYNFTSVNLSYNSDRRKVLSYSIRSSIGQFFTGNRYSASAEIRLRAQPYFSALINASYNYIDLPSPHPTESIWLIGPRIDFTFTKTLYWSTFFQYSTQQDLFSINSRVQWRFKPLSDLFIVYNDNYHATNFSPRTRALFLKFTYWINI